MSFLDWTAGMVGFVPDFVVAGPAFAVGIDSAETDFGEAAVFDFDSVEAVAGLERPVDWDHMETRFHQGLSPLFPHGFHLHP